MDFQFRNPRPLSAGMLSDCMKRRRLMFIGDSHTEKMFYYLTTLPNFDAFSQKSWKMRKDGMGIYANIGTDPANYEAYTRREINATFRDGAMLANLQKGLKYYNKHVKDGYWLKGAAEQPEVGTDKHPMRSEYAASYDELQKRYKFDTWLFQSGHWDLRDSSVEEYVERTRLLFIEFRKFGDRHGVRLVWMGSPAYAI